MSEPRSGAARIAAGIFSSRVLGLVRERAVAFYFGPGDFADAFQTAFRIPNLLQNLLGEQTLSAGFIPVYSRLVEQGRREEASRLAGAVFGLLVVAVSALVLIGIFLAKPLVMIFANGYLGDADRVAAGVQTVDRFALTVRAVPIIFPMTGTLVLSAWALGILNSHRRFFLPYFAPVIWNICIIGGLMAVGSQFVAVPFVGEGPSGLVIAGCVAALVGGILQFVVQLPSVSRELSGFHFSVSTTVVGVRDVLKAFGPALAGRGVVQLAGFLDLFMASYLTSGAVGALTWAQRLYTLPISLFGMSVAAAELPELARVAGTGETLVRLQRSLRAMAFTIIPSTVGCIAFGYLMVGALYRTGRFGVGGQVLVSAVLAVYALGIPSSAYARLLQNTFFSTGDTKTPAWIATGRVVVAGVTGALTMFYLDRFSVGVLVVGDGEGSALRFGAVGLAIGSALSSWFEVAMLKRALRERIQIDWLSLRDIVLASGGSALAAGLIWWALPALAPIPEAAAVLSAYGVLYLAFSHSLRIPEARVWLRRLRVPVR